MIGLLLGLVAIALNSLRWLGSRFKPASTSMVVLILEPYGMGDLVSLEPLIRRLRELKYEVRLSAKGCWRPLYPASTISEWLDSEIPWTSYSDHEKYRWSSYWSHPFRAYVRELRRLGRGSIGIDPRGDIRSIILLQLAGCRVVYSLGNYLGTDLRVSPLAATTTPFREDVKRWEINLAFLNILQVNRTTKRSPPRFEHFRVSVRTDAARHIGLAPVAPWTGKLWDRKKWVELTARLLSDGWEVHGLCGPRQSSVATAELGGSVRVEECGSVEAWADKLAALNCLVTIDSGPMHLADALGIPVIALFGQGKLPLWAPSGPQSRVISHQTDPDFSPCHPIEANAHIGKSFMSRISVQEVLDAVKEISRIRKTDGGPPVS